MSCHFRFFKLAVSVPFEIPFGFISLSFFLSEICLFIFFFFIILFFFPLPFILIVHLVFIRDARRNKLRERGLSYKIKRPVADLRNPCFVCYFFSPPFFFSSKFIVLLFVCVSYFLALLFLIRPFSTSLSNLEREKVCPNYLVKRLSNRISRLLF